MSIPTAGNGPIGRGMTFQSLKCELTRYLKETCRSVRYWTTFYKQRKWIANWPLRISIGFDFVSLSWQRCATNECSKSKLSFSKFSTILRDSLRFIAILWQPLTFLQTQIRYSINVRRFFFVFYFQKLWLIFYTPTSIQHFEKILRRMLERFSSDCQPFFANVVPPSGRLVNHWGGGGGWGV